MGLFGLVWHLTPSVPAYVRAHNALEIGKIMLVTGVAQLAVAPVCGIFGVRRVDDRHLTALGPPVFGIGSALKTLLNRESQISTKCFGRRLIRGGCAIMFRIPPPTQLALGQLAKTAVADASGSLNLIRYVGGAIGRW